MTRPSKPVNLLTLDDLATFPIWEYIEEDESGDRDETWVRPLDARSVPIRSYTIVAASFRIAGGQEFEGEISVSRLEEPAEFFNGVIHKGDVRSLIPNPELCFFDRAMTILLDGLGLSQSEVFPIAFTLRVPFDGEQDCRCGILDGRKADPPKSGPLEPIQRTFW